MRKKNKIYVNITQKIWIFQSYFSHLRKIYTMEL